MPIGENAKTYHKKMLPGGASAFNNTDPEYIELFDNFAFDEVIRQDDLEDSTRFIAILATLLGCQGYDEYRAMVPAALNFGVTPVEIREIVYQAVAYLGIGRVFPFLKATNELFTARGIAVFLIKVVSQCLPYIGYPRSLNALRCVSDAAKSLEG